MADENYDVIIVGAGMAGFLVAARIAEKGVNPRNGEPLNVALVERGPYLPGTPRSGYGVPLRRQMFTQITREFHENGRYQMQYHPDGPDGPNTFPHSAASVVGGGSLHWRAMTRVPREMDYRAWSEVHDASGWTSANFRDAAEEVAEMFNIHSRPDEMVPRGDLLYRDTAKRMGLTVVDSQVAKKNCIMCWGCEGSNFCKYDSRMGSFVAYLPIAEKHGVHIIPDAEVQKIEIENQRATGVLYKQKGMVRRITAPKIIVSCGAFGTPLLLMRSGYGPRDLLGANTLVENPNVGRNIDGRPGPMVLTGIFSEPMTDGAYADGGFYVIHDTGSDPRMERFQVRWEPIVLGDPDRVALNALAPEFGREHKEFMRQISNPQLRTKAKTLLTNQGRILIRLVRPRQVYGSVDDRGAWSYDPHHPSLAPLFRKAKELAGSILREMGAKEVLETRSPTGTSFNSNTGSCRAGSDRRTSVVNPFFESHDVDNLLIVDASATPFGATIGYGAPTATVAAFAYRRIIERHFTR